MTPITLPQAVLQLAAESGAFVSSTSDGSGLEIGDSETNHVVRRAHDVFTVDEVQRGRTTGVVLRTAEEAALFRFLALILGSRWRAATGMGELAPAPRDPPEGTALDTSDWRHSTVRWVEGGTERWADDLVDYRAADLARTLVYPLDVVVAAVREPSGAPVFT
ncbi:hypothetical protein [Cellulomonas sp. KH9]|uniref:hypothetical protein n=1 Tax=Cellulomonas sp. KH9 TaxID=1855324 RepID=UPI0008F23AAB|nr:hypothetical protein [Cellulomonas sp. KH9]SFJ63401.1 hypothetical protein SAMN05216467_0268 [Cellulomonas sp. KH9]